MKKCLLCIAILTLAALFLTGCCCCLSTDSTPPPAGTYGVSSVGTMDGSVQYSYSLTHEIMVIEKDGTGTFYFGGEEYDIAFDDGKLQAEGRELSYQYTSGDADEAMLLIYWQQDDVNTIILRPIQETIFFQF